MTRQLVWWFVPTYVLAVFGALAGMEVRHIVEALLPC